MKTENEFSEYFLIHCTKTMNSSEELHFISQNYWSDLTSHLPYFFSHEARLSITEIAADKFCQEMLHNTSELAWQNVIRDFNKNNFWGFHQILIKPKPVKNDEQKIFWQLFKYTWAFFQSMIILKIAVYYFGLESASRPDQVNVVWVWFFFTLSAGSLGYFAYRNRND